MSIDAPIEDNIRAVAKALEKDVNEVTVIVLDRPRHSELVSRIRAMGSRILLIGDGDVSASITSWANSGIDMLVGIGGARGCDHSGRAQVFGW